MRHSTILALVSMTVFYFSFAAAADTTSSPEWKTPAVNEGKVVILPEAVFQPQAESKAVFAVTQQNSATEIAKGLVRVARWLNINAGAGIRPEQMAVTVVLSGDTTKAALSHAAYKTRAGEKENPNLKLIEQLSAPGVQFFVCGQALAQNGFAQSDVAPGIQPATAALTVMIQRQQAGYALLQY